MDFEKLLERLPEVDALIVEGTMISRETFDKNIEEEFLEEIAEDELSRYSGPAFLLSSAMNVDRIMSAIGDGVPAPGNEGIRVFMKGGDRQYELLKQYEKCKIGKGGGGIAHSKFLMCVRQKNSFNLKELVTGEGLRYFLLFIVGACFDFCVNGNRNIL